MTYLNKYALLNGLMFCALVNPVLAEENDWLSHTYTMANIGRANSHVSVDRMQIAFDQAGIVNTSIDDVDGRRIGYGIGLGYEITANWAVELAYLDLGQVDVDFTSIQAVNNLEEVHPESGDGFTLSVLYKHILDAKTNIRVRFGAFDWSADYQTTQGNGTVTGTDSNSGTDIYWGAGLGHQVTDELTLIGEIQHFDFDRDNTTYLTFGAEWRY